MSMHPDFVGALHAARDLIGRAAAAVHGSLGVVTRDVVVTVAKGGWSGELTEFAARRKERGARPLVLTGAPDSPLAALADAFASALTRLRGYSWESVLHAHPAGAVGHLTAADIARTEVS
jgi:D-arabinose 5-phosphate isomerase GutQ